MSEIKTRTLVDEDWKARVQREKEEARLKSLGIQPATTQETSADAPAQPGSPASPPPEEEASPAFDALINTLATQAMYCLGFIGAPGQGQAVVNLDQAKDILEMVMMVRDKTQGNLNAQESALLTETLAELQRLFAARVHQAQAQAMQRAGIDPSNLRGEMPH